MPMLGLCLDGSRWTGDVTRDQAERLKADGVVEWMAACGPGGYGLSTQQQLDDTSAVGIIPSAYTFYEWGNNPRAWIEAARDSLGPFAETIQRFSIDIEDVDHPVPADWVGQVNALFAVADALFPHLKWKPGGIVLYLPGWYYRGYLGGLADITTWNGQRRTLHNSFYDGDPDIDGLPFGGFEVDDLALEQYEGSFQFDGLNVDVNEIYIAPYDLPAAPDQPAPEEEDEMKPEDKALLDATVALLGGPQRVLRNASEGDDLWLGYQMEQEKLAIVLAELPNDIADAAHKAADALAESYKVETHELESVEPGEAA